MSNAKLLFLANLFLFFVGLDIVLYKEVQERKQFCPPVEQQIISVPVERPKEEPKPINYTISTPVPTFLQYPDLVKQLNQWKEQAPELVEVGTYGQSKGIDLHYIRINNRRITEDKPVVLITAAIHGNEPWSTTTMMGCIGTILDKYGDDEKITAIVDSRDLYVIPVVCPETFTRQREVDGRDPNRDFPTQRSPDKVSVAPVQALREFFLKIKPSAVISGHTFGRVYLYPWGDSQRPSPNDEDYKRIVGQMGSLSHYGMKQAGFNYGVPIFGTEIDWYYRNGAFSLVMEIGAHQRPPNPDEVRSEFERTFGAILHFIEEAPKVEIRQYVISDWRTAA